MIDLVLEFKMWLCNVYGDEAYHESVNDYKVYMTYFKEFQDCEGRVE